MIYPDPYTQIDLVSNASFLHLHPKLPKALIATQTNLAISIHSTTHKDYVKSSRLDIILLSSGSMTLEFMLNFGIIQMSIGLLNIKDLVQI